MLHPPGFYYVKKPKRFVILSSDKSSERNLSCFFDIKNPGGWSIYRVKNPSPQIRILVTILKALVQMLRNTDKSSHFPKKILSDIIMADEEIKIPVVSPRKSIQELEKSMIFNKDIKMNEEGKGGLF